MSVVYRCGLCCGKRTACDTCLHNSLKATGLPDTQENFDRLRAITDDKSGTWTGWATAYTWELSKMIRESL